MTFAVLLVLIVAAVICFGIALNSLLTHNNPAVKAAQAPTWVPEAAEGTVPRPGSRRWARAQYHSGNIGIEELCRFCAEHPERLDDHDR